MYLYENSVRRIHFHQTMEIGYCYDGHGIFVVGKKEYLFNAGDIVVINPMHIHRAFMPNGKPSKWSFVMFDPVELLTTMISGSPTIFNKAITCTTCLIPEKQKIVAITIVKEMINEWESKKIGYKEKIKALVTQFLIERVRVQSNIKRSAVKNSIKKYETSITRLIPALDYINREYPYQIKIDRLAQLCAMCKGHFCREFVRVLNKSPLEYIQTFRIEMSCSLLFKSNMSISEIALSNGFQTLSCFNRQFQKQKGCSPREWRQKTVEFYD